MLRVCRALNGDDEEDIWPFQGMDDYEDEDDGSIHRKVLDLSLPKR